MEYHRFDETFLLWQDLTFGGELLISNSTIGAGVGGLRFGQSVGTSVRDPWAVDPSSDRDSWDSWNPAQSAAVLKPPAWGATDHAGPPPASLNQIMLEERLAEQRQAAAPVPASTVNAIVRPSGKSGARAALSRARGGSSAARNSSSSVARSANERANGVDRDAEADPHKVASEVATGTADFILGGEDESGVAAANIDQKFSSDGGGNSVASKVPLPYDGAARWEKAVGAVGTWDPWDMHKIGYSAGFGAGAGDGSGFSAARLTAQPPLGLGFLPLQQPMWSTDGLGANNSLWGLQPTTVSGPTAARTALPAQVSASGAASSAAKVTVGHGSPSGQMSGKGSQFARGPHQPQAQALPSQQAQAQRNQIPRQQGKVVGGSGVAIAADSTKKGSGRKGGNNQKQQDFPDRQSANTVRRSDPGASAVRRPDSTVKLIDPVNSAKDSSGPVGTQQMRLARGGHRGGPPRNAHIDGQIPAAERHNVPQQQSQLQQQQAVKPVSARSDERSRRDASDAAGRGSRAPRSRAAPQPPNRASSDAVSGLRDGAGTLQTRGQQ